MNHRVYNFQPKVILILAVVSIVCFCVIYVLNFELLYKVYYNPSRSYKIEIRYKIYSIFTNWYAQGRPGNLYLKNENNIIIHKAQVGYVGYLSDNIIKWGDNYVQIHFDKWFYSADTMTSKIGFEQ